MNESKLYAFPDDFTSFDVARKLAEFRRNYAYTGPVKIIIPVEKEYRLRGLKYDFFAMQGVDIEIGLVAPNEISIEKL